MLALLTATRVINTQYLMQQLALNGRSIQCNKHFSRTGLNTVKRRVIPVQQHGLIVFVATTHKSKTLELKDELELITSQAAQMRKILQKMRLNKRIYHLT